MAVRGATPLVAAFLVALAAISTVAPPVAAANGNTESATTTYTLDVAHGTVNVASDVKLTNQKPSTTESYSCIKYTYDSWLGSVPYASTCTRTLDYYLYSTAVWVEKDATNVRATSGGSRLSVKIGKPDPYFRRVDIAFPNLYYGKSRTLHVTYTIPGGRPRSSSDTRAMHAYANFCVVAQGYDSGVVNVRVPAGFEISTTGSSLTASTAGTDSIYSSGPISDTSTWWSCLEGTNASGYAVRQLTAPDGRPVILESWPEDAEWTTAVQTDVLSDMPALVRLVGRPMSGSAPLVVKETVTGSEYAGFYDTGTNTITVDEDFGQPGLVGHELAHVWFNDSLFDDTWLSEGYAEWAGRDVETSTTPCTQPAAGSSQPSLASWRYLTPKSTEAERADVSFQYDAACYVVTRIAGAAGTAGMTRAMQALLAGEDPYATDPSATGSKTSHAVTWQQWLDAVDELALGSAGAPSSLASDLLVQYGATKDPATLKTRVAARDAYHALQRTVTGWTVPEAVRAPLRAWEFTAAQDTIKAALDAWTITGTTDRTLAGVDARSGPAAKAWASADTMDELLAANALAQRQLDAARRVADAISVADAPRDLVQEIGLIGATVPSTDPAVAAVRSIDTDQATSIADGISDVIGGARSAGEIRITVTSLALAVGVLLLVIVMRRRRRAARALALSMAAAAVADETPAAAIADETPVIAVAADPDAPGGQPAP